MSRFQRDLNQWRVNQLAKQWRPTVMNVSSGQVIPASPQPRAERVPELAAEPFRGYRVWQADRSGVLHAVGVHYRWVRGAQRAEHLLDTPFNTLLSVDHRVAKGGCSCGFWAFKDPELLRGQLETFILWAYHHGRMLVGGKVDLWGHVTEHRNGYRGEFARIVGPLRFLMVGSPGTPELSVLAEMITGIYEVPVEL